VGPGGEVAALAVVAVLGEVQLWADEQDAAVERKEAAVVEDAAVEDGEADIEEDAVGVARGQEVLFCRGVWGCLVWGA
jgi:hypothetical protein